MRHLYDQDWKTKVEVQFNIMSIAHVKLQGLQEVQRELPDATSEHSVSEVLQAVAFVLEQTMASKIKQVVSESQEIASLAINLDGASASDLGGVLKAALPVVLKRCAELAPRVR